MNEVTIFNNPEFGEIRTLETEDGKVLFCGKDVAAALGYKDTVNALKAHCKGVAKHHLPHPQSPDKTIEMTFIPESDVYRLAFGSKLPTAEKFTDWVTEEVLPSIRKNGCYSKQEISPMLQYLIQMEQKQNALEAKQKELEQKLDFNRKEVIEAALSYGCIGSFHQSEVQKTVRLKAIEECRTAQAFDTVGKSVINAIYKALQQYFGIPSYKDLRINQMAEARAFILDWMPSPELREKIAKATPKPKFNLMDLL